jgi:predicted RNase H-like nuclease (RuvC/YqgF family)
MLGFIKQEQQIRELRSALKQANKELEKLRAQNESMREGMRRCVTCEYRIEVKLSGNQNSNLAEQSEGFEGK